MFLNPLIFPLPVFQDWSIAVFPNEPLLCAACAAHSSKLPVPPNNAKTHAPRQTKTRGTLPVKSGIRPKTQPRQVAQAIPPPKPNPNAIVIPTHEASTKLPIPTAFYFRTVLTAFGTPQKAKSLKRSPRSAFEPARPKGVDKSRRDVQRTKSGKSSKTKRVQ
jgi:hypothetical protein